MRHKKQHIPTVKVDSALMDELNTKPDMLTALNKAIADDLNRVYGPRPALASPEVGAKPVISLTLQSMTIKREGQVEWRVAGDHHCGPKGEIRDGKIPVKYSVTVTCAPHLDDRGFLFDQAAVDLWMKRQAEKETTLSCEALVVETATQMLLKLQRDVPHCKVTELVMTLSPSPFQAGVTCRFA